MLNNRRSELEIIAEILTVSRNGAKTTEILYKGYLSYTQFKLYLPYLVKKNILSEESSNGDNGYSRKYITTQKGRELLKDIEKTLSYFK